MAWRQTAAVATLALAAGVAGLVAGSILTGQGAPRSITDLLSRTAATRWLADAWIAAATPAPPPGTRVAAKGEPAPVVPLTDLKGNAAQLSQWSGSLVVVNFWATWCAPCRKEMPALDRFQQRHAGSGVQIVGVAIDNGRDVDAFLHDTPVSYPILLATSPTANPSLPFGNTYGALPFSVLLDRDGRILDTRLGEVDEDQLQTWIAPHLASMP